MKTNNVKVRIYALAISVLFATIATAGIAVLMTASGEQVRTELTMDAAARQTAQAPAPALTQWQAPAAVAKKVL